MKVSLAQWPVSAQAEKTRPLCQRPLVGARLITPLPLWLERRPAEIVTGSQDYGVDVRTILVELGNRRMVGGQEDMIVDVALDILKQQGREAPTSF